MKMYTVQQIYIPPWKLTQRAGREEWFGRKSIYGPILAECPTYEEARAFFDGKTASGTYCILYSKEVDEHE